ncbi:DUF427 domain-containing protein [Candidatus Oscillochloris fontis]|uniref:DUF427 domain-containing protein n=1 Tax=Candidatus Oscillochloris fontis TaxID=2496868 RepID=UPI00101C15A9|nr:DUF427 domain-containing protein [Candidatus Oscillochloris fontis]
MITRIEPGPGQESVWDYPRPPRLEPTRRQIRIIFQGIEIVNTCRAYRVLETSHPPVYYLPPDDIQMQYLRPTSRRSVCEWKGQATYYTLRIGDARVVDVAWTYLNPTPTFAAIAGYLAFYVRPMDACYVDTELVTPQPGEFYGGWITSEIVGPFKGSPGTWGW